MGIVVVLGAAAGAQVIANTNNATDRVLNHTQPALLQATRLQNALINQESGVRGYAISGDRQFLEPYTDGLQEQSRAVERIRTLVAGSTDLLADLDAVQHAADNWRANYAHNIDASPVALAATSAQGKALFDELRARFDTQTADLTDAIAADRRALEYASALRNWVLATMVAIALLTGAILTGLARRLVAQPLSALAAASSRVAEGDFDHHIDIAGPADVATVADVVERMRRRVVSELTAARAQEAVLSQQKAELDLQAEELRRSNTELEQFAYVASHDLQEPLRKVASFCQLLDKRYGDKLDERGKQYIEFAVDGAKRMQILINDLLTFSRVGRVAEATTRVDLRATLDAAVSDLSAVIEDNGVQLELPAQLPEVVGESTLLTMLWQNLIANAIKFRAPDRAPLVRVDCELDAASGTWQLSVTDNGIGIAAEFSEQVFVIFQRLHSREEYGGTGIGLAVCRKIVEYHGGKIWVDTAHTEGTRFRFTLPVLVEDNPAIPAAPAVEGVPL
ncbi:ATP-binding protein [Nocardia sp. NPDC046473]|uniref:ATP-binding protein n=1 Tax=Nocardia sp. NPDC046473 TaxID=3155733 RepID=UPI0033EBD0B9